MCHSKCVCVSICYNKGLCMCPLCAWMCTPMCSVHVYVYVCLSVCHKNGLTVRLCLSVFGRKACLSVADPGFSQGGAPTLGAGAAGIKFNFLLRKLHDIEKILAARGGGAPGAPPSSATAGGPCLKVCLLIFDTN